MSKLIVAVQYVGWSSMRILRSAWVLFTNGTAIYLLHAGTRQDMLLNHLLEQVDRNRGLWFHFALKATIPFLGILLEFLGWRFAKWINIGYFLFVGAIFSAIGIWNWPDHHGFLYLLLGLAALAVAGVSWLFYRRPHSSSAVPLSE